MITSFSCKEIRLEEIIRCAFELNVTEYRVLTYLMENDEKFNTAQIFGEMDLDRTTVQKALTELMNKNLAFRTQSNLKNGGYTFLYQVKDKEKIKETARERIDNWCNSVKSTVKEW